MLKLERQNEVLTAVVAFLLHSMADSADSVTVADLLHEFGGVRHFDVDEVLGGVKSLVGSLGCK